MAPAVGTSSVPFSDLLRPLMGAGTRLRSKRLATLALRTREVKKAHAFQTRRPLNLHLGSGGNNLDGWVNVDLVGADADVVWDLSVPLPFDPATADAVFLEHVFEHMTLAEIMTVMTNICRVMKPLAVLRVGVPDAGAYARSYASGDGIIDELRPGRPTRMMALAEVFQEHGHLSAWDDESLCLLLTSFGFEGVAETPGAQSCLSPAPDREDRIPESVYVEGVVPA